MSLGSKTAAPFNRSAQHRTKHQAVLSQAAQLFNTKGSRATTLQDIAQTLGLTKNSLYYYVKTKEDLIYQCYMMALEHHLHRLDQIESKHKDPRNRCSALFYQHFEVCAAAREGRGPHIAALLEIASLKGNHRKDVEAKYTAMFQRVRQYLREGINEGLFGPMEPTSTTRAILGSLEWTFYWLNSIPAQNIVTTANAAIDILIYGLHSGSERYEPSLARYQYQAKKLSSGFDREQRNLLKQEAFYKTGTRCFNQRGFNGTSLDDIAEFLNVSKGAFYYHIRNKEDLLFNCYRRSLEIVEDINLQASQLPATGLEKVEYVCGNIFRIQNSDDGPLIRYNTITALPDAKRQNILKRVEAANAIFNAFIGSGIADGSIRNIDTAVAGNLISGAINAAMGLNRWRDVSDTDIAAFEYFDVFYNGLIAK